jgi:hypothetical protein
MDASVASEPAASPDEAPTSRGETKLINRALQSGGARCLYLGRPRPPARGRPHRVAADDG